MQNYNLIRFYKNKITTFVYVDEEIDFKEVSLEELGLPISEYFNHVVDFAENFTVKDFVVILKKYSDEIDKYFSAYNHGCEFDIYCKEITNNPQPDCINECDEIEIVWDTDVFRENGINYISDWVTFCGRINNFRPQHEFDLPIRNMHIVPLRDWKDLPLKLNKCVYYQETSPFKIKKSPVKLQGIKQFNLFNLLSGFIYELTHHGTPEQQIALANEIKAQIRNYNEALIDSPLQIIPFDEGFHHTEEVKSEPVESLDSLNKKLKKYIDSEEFEKAQKIKEKINLLKNN